MNSEEIPNITDATDPMTNSNWRLLLFDDICVTKNSPANASPMAKVVIPYIGYILVAIGGSQATLSDKYNGGTISVASRTKYNKIALREDIEQLSQYVKAFYITTKVRQDAAIFGAIIIPFKVRRLERALMDISFLSNYTYRYYCGVWCHEDFNH